MSHDREKLLRRLWRVLDTVDNDAELVATVRRIREWSDPDVFQRRGAANGTVSFAATAKGRHAHLRALGFIMQRYMHGTADIQAAKERVERALQDGTEASAEDIVLTLLFLRTVVSVLQERAQSHPQSHPRVDLRGDLRGGQTEGASMNEVLRASLEEVTRAMGL